MTIPNFKSQHDWEAFTAMFDARWHCKAKSADKLILNRVYNQLCGLNIKEISVTPSV